MSWAIRWSIAISSSSRAEHRTMHMTLTYVRIADRVVADQYAAVSEQIDDRPRKTLGYMTPSEAYAQVVALTA